MEISTVQDARHNLNMACHTVNSTLFMYYDELNMFTGSLTYSVRRFIFSVMAQKRGHGTMPLPLNTLLFIVLTFREINDKNIG